jgi:DNA-binding MarR family transcriptional regulator
VVRINRYVSVPGCSYAASFCSHGDRVPGHPGLQYIPGTKKGTNGDGMKDYDYQQLDEVIHSRIRLAIMTLLISVEQAEFTFIRDKISTTDGNLSIHLRKLEESGYIRVQKRFMERKPVSSYSITTKGHQAFEKYVEQLEQMIKK